MQPNNDQKAYISRVSQAIREARRRRGTTQQQIAEALGLTHTSISLFKKDRALPQKYIKRFCAITKVPVEWLVSGEDRRRTETPDKPQLQSEQRQAYILRVSTAVSHARRKSGISVGDMARYIGIDQSTLSNYCHSRAMPSRHLKLFCEITGVRADWLIRGTGRMVSDPWVDNKLEFLASLSEPERRRLDSLIELLLASPEK